MNTFFILGNTPQDHSPSFYQNAELFIVSSLYEDFDIPVLESIATCTRRLIYIPVVCEVGGVAAD